MQTLGPADDRKHVQVVEGEKLRVELPEAPSTGFRWVPKEIPPQIRLLTDDFEAAAPRLLGAPGNHSWTLEAVRAGTGELRFQLVARTPRATAPQVFTVFINVICA